MILRFLDGYTKVLEKLIIVLMFALLIAVALQVMGRYIVFIPRFLWTVDVANFSLIWVIFLGSIIAVRENRHFFVDFLPADLPAGVNLALRVSYYIFMYSVSLVFVVFGFKFLKMGLIQESETIGLNMGFIYVSVPFAGISWLIFLGENIYREFFLFKSSGEDRS